MWYLQSFNNSLIYFWNKDTYIVGRKNNDIIIENDNSISRNHGLFTIKNDDLFITDLGSKYGTIVGNSKLTPNITRQIFVDNIVTFGLREQRQSKFIVKKVHLKIVLSNVRSEERHTQYTALDKLQICPQSYWDSNCTHVVVSELILTSKILCAVTMGQHIVNLDFFPDFVQAVKNNYELPNEKNYFPKINNTLLNKNIVLEYQHDRKYIFKDTKFVFLTESLKKYFEEVIRTTGGEAISWCGQELSIDQIRADFNFDKYIFIKDKIKMINEDSKVSKYFYYLLEFLDFTGRRAISSREIALAIIHNSKSRYCNIRIKRRVLTYVDIPLNSTSVRKEINVCANKNKPKSIVWRTWINNRLIKRNISQAKLSKLNNLFKNSIQIQFSPVTVTRTIFHITNKGGKNFKKFNKTHRICERESVPELNKVRVRIDGTTEEEHVSSYEYSDTRKRKSYQRRRFQLCL